MKKLNLALLAALAICLGGTSAVYAQAIGSPAGAAAPSGSKHIATAQVVVGASATLLARARSGRQSVTIENTGTNGLFIGDASVTGATGYILWAILAGQRTRRSPFSTKGRDAEFVDVAATTFEAFGAGYHARTPRHSHPFEGWRAAGLLRPDSEK